MKNTIFSSRDIDEFISDIANEVVKKIRQIEIVEEKRKPLDTFLTIQQVSKLLGVSLVTLHKWKKEGKIKYHRFGSRIRFRQSEILNFKK